jgi:uncharacterized membrane protein
MEPMARKVLVLIISLIVIGTTLFVSGVIIEHSGSGTSAAASTAQGQPSTGSQDTDGGHESPGSTQRSSAIQAKAGLPMETVFGLDLENPWFVTAFALIWLVFIAALVRFGRIILPAVLLVAILATVLDAGEVVRQIGEAKSLLATTAVLVTVAHVALALLALLVLIQGFRPHTARPV